MVGWLLTYLSGPEDHQRMASVFGFDLTFCYKAYLENHLSDERMDTTDRSRGVFTLTESKLLTVSIHRFFLFYSLAPLTFPIHL
jgi:hypothetical protein